jgi:two-component system CheB/CheR fusion protein
LNQLKNSNPELDEYLKIINNSVKKFQSLIKELSMIGKIESDIFKTEAIDLKNMIDEIVLSIENKIKSSKAIITTDLPIAEVQFSKKNLRSILFNLISNSLKYKSDKHRPHIKITTEMEEDFMVLSVQDDGVGIPKNDLHKIFNLYHQLQHDKEGEGIGLYLVKKVVEGAGGKIIVESEPDTGSTFKIYIKAEPVLLKKPSLN